MSASLKSWATPLAVGTFSIIAVTGMLLFFDIEIGFVEPVHKWASWAFVAGVLLHVISNWKALTHYFSSKPALAIIGTAMVVLVATLLPFGEKEENENPAKMAAYALSSSSLETVALVVKSTPDVLSTQLAAKGLVVSSPTATIEQIAKSNGKEPKEVLANILSLSKGKAEHDGDDD